MKITMDGEYPTLPRVYTGWVNVYAVNGSCYFSEIFESKEAAIIGAANGRIACIQLPPFTHGEGIGDE